MSTRAWVGGIGVIALLTFTSLGVWVYWETTTPGDAWLINEPERIVSDFDPSEQLDVTFQLRNTARVPRRILGATAC
jgi:hypothetical protein